MHHIFVFSIDPPIVDRAGLLSDPKKKNVFSFISYLG
jgi:hypothetical protein